MHGLRSRSHGSCLRLSPGLSPCPSRPGERQSGPESTKPCRREERLPTMSFVLSYNAIAKRIDHSLLAPTMTDTELEAGCRLAVAYGVASVCIKPYAVRLAAGIVGPR